MALEAVDKRNPPLVRVAEITQVEDSRVCIHFCGWDTKFDFWEDAHSPDLHPVGWYVDLVYRCYYSHCVDWYVSLLILRTSLVISNVVLANIESVVYFLGFRCQKTGHPLLQPLTPLSIVNYSGICPTVGCYGYGHVKGSKFTSHYR